jgi:hypothetical protein
MVRLPLEGMPEYAPPVAFTDFDPDPENVEL